MDASRSREQILAWLDRMDEWHETSDCPVKAGECIHSATDAVRAVVELHAPGTRLGEEDQCKGCEIRDVAFVWLDRCKTLAAVAEALGINAKESAT
jgi:hypothetical protein